MKVPFTGYLWIVVVPFVCGIVCTCNLISLLGINSNYHAAWWKVGLAIVLAIAIPISKMRDLK